MEQYISKSALVAEIEKLHGTPFYKMAIKDVLSILDTLEVKEVDLEKPFEGIKVQTSMGSGSLDEIIVTTKYKAQKGE